MALVAKLARQFLLLVALLVVCWAFFDLGRRYVERQRALRERPIELTVMHWGTPAEDAIVQRLCDTFQRENPKVRIVRINPGAGGFPQKLKTMMAAGTPPDVFYLRPDMMPDLAQMELIAPLDRYVANEPKEWVDDFFPVLLDAMRYDRSTGLVGGNGTLYGLPKDFTTAIFWINTDLYDQAGVDWRRIQKEGWTWDEFEAVMKQIRALTNQPGYEGREIYGAVFNIWPDTLRNILWTTGGEFFDADVEGKANFRELAFDTPGSQRGLELIRRMRLEDRTVFNATGIAKDGGQEFLNGNIASMGPIGRWEAPRLKGVTKFKWDVLPVPRGVAQASQIFYTGWGMASVTKHPDEAYQLIRFLTGREGQVQQAHEGLAIPSLKSVAYSDAFLNPPGFPPHNAQLFLDAINHVRLGQNPRQQEFGRLVEDHINRAIQTGRATPKEAAEALQAAWTTELNSPLRQKQWDPMPWGTILSVGGAVLAAAIAGLWFKARREALGPLDRATERAGFTFISPWIIGFLLLTFGPMLVSLLLSVSQWTGMTPLSDARYVGTANFRQLFTYDPTFLQSLKVTAYFVLLGVPVSQVAALVIAMLMNSNIRGIAVFRTIYFVPSVVSGAALAVLWLQLFNNDYGLINAILRPILRAVGWNTLAAGVILGVFGVLLLRAVLRRAETRGDVTMVSSFVPGMLAGAGVTLAVVALVMIARGVVGPNPPNWFGVDTTADPPVNDAARWAIPAFVIMGLWGVGGGMIIYLAGLKGIPVSLYEAARIDGAGPVKQIFAITLPMLSPLIFYNLVMGIIGSFQVFTQAYIMTGAGPENATLFYVLQLYRQAFEFHNMGYASAMAWILFVIVLLLTLGVFKGSKNLVYYEGLR